jgi:YVTN family beta-propeller protein
VLEPGPLPDARLSDLPSDQRTFDEVDELSGDMTPKSVVASGTGLVVAQNMIYTHTVSVFNSNGKLLETVDDAIVPADFGFPEWDDEVEGGPVEAAFSRDGSQLWVSNYSMYGPGFGSPGDDDCTPETGVDPSFLYRIDTSKLEIADAVLVGAVPKFLEVTPDGRYVLVTNWCTWDLSVVDTAAGEEVARVGIGRYPRGVAISPDSTTAYVAVMGGSEIAVVDIAAAVAGAGDDAVRTFDDVGRGPRHLNLSPDGRWLYATLNKDGEVVKIDTTTGEVVGAVRTGEQPRSAALSADGTALFVVNYESDTVSRVRTSDLEVLESVPVDHHPIGITYDALTQRIWVASYGGTLAVFDDAAP